MAPECFLPYSVKNAVAHQFDPPRSQSGNDRETRSPKWQRPWNDDFSTWPSLRGKSLHSQRPPSHNNCESTAVKWRLLQHRATTAKCNDREATSLKLHNCCKFCVGFCVASWLLSFQVPFGSLWVVKFDGEICGGVLVENACDDFPRQKKLENLLPNFAGSSPPISPKTWPTSLWKSLVLTHMDANVYKIHGFMSAKLSQNDNLSLNVPRGRQPSCLRMDVCCTRGNQTTVQILSSQWCNLHAWIEAPVPALLLQNRLGPTI